jgi:hypothetical protein
VRQVVSFAQLAKWIASSNGKLGCYVQFARKTVSGHTASIVIDRLKVRCLAQRVNDKALNTSGQWFALWTTRFQRVCCCAISGRAGNCSWRQCWQD